MFQRRADFHRERGIKGFIAKLLTAKIETTVSFCHNKSFSHELLNPIINFCLIPQKKCLFTVTLIFVDKSNIFHRNFETLYKKNLEKLIKNFVFQNKSFRVLVNEKFTLKKD